MKCSTLWQEDGEKRSPVLIIVRRRACNAMTLIIIIDVKKNNYIATMNTDKWLMVAKCSLSLVLSNT